MAIYDTSNLFPFDNEVLELKIEDQLKTKLDMFQFATADYSLAESAGNLKKIRTYIGTGDVEDVAMGYGNTGDIGAGYVEKEYRVAYTQGRFPYYDEQIDADPEAINAGITRLHTSMTNDLTTKVVNELLSAPMAMFECSWTFDNIVDALAMFPDEQVDGLFLLISKAEEAAFRKNLEDSLKYVEGFVRTGYIGSICGVPVYMSNAVPAGKAILANREAVRIFVKKGASVAQERDENTRKNTVYARKSSVVALYDATKAVVLLADEDPREGYTLVTSETAPADWATKYNTDYYVYDSAAKEMKLNTEATYVKNKFYTVAE